MLHHWSAALQQFKVLLLYLWSEICQDLRSAQLLWPFLELLICLRHVCTCAWQQMCNLYYEAVMFDISSSTTQMFNKTKSKLFLDANAAKRLVWPLYPIHPSLVLLNQGCYWQLEAFQAQRGKGGAGGAYCSVVNIWSVSCFCYEAPHACFITVCA